MNLTGKNRINGAFTASLVAVLLAISSLLVMSYQSTYVYTSNVTTPHKSAVRTHGTISTVDVTLRFGEASYIIGKYNSTHYNARNATTGEYRWISTNATYVVNSAIGNGNVSVFIKQGTYILYKSTSRTAITLKNNTYIYGEGIGLTILRLADGQYTDIIHGGNDWNPITTIENVRIESLTLDGNKANNIYQNVWNRQNGIWIGRGTKIVVQSVEAKENAGANFHFDTVKKAFLIDSISSNGIGVHYGNVDVSSAFNEDVVIDRFVHNNADNLTDGSEGNGIDIGITKRLSIANSEIYDCEGHGILIIGEQITVVGNNIKNTTLSGIKYMKAAYGTEGIVSIIGNTLKYAGSVGSSLTENIGIQISGNSNTHVSKIVVIDNVIEESEKGMSLWYVDDIIITSNIITSNKINQSTINSNTYGVVVKQSDRNMMDGNKIKDFYYGIFLDQDADGNIVESNTISGSNTAIRIDQSDCNNNVVKGNSISSVTTVYQDVGTGTVWGKGNIIDDLPCESTVTFSSINNGTYVAHGLAGTPEIVIVTLTVQGYSWVGTTNSTHVQLYFNITKASGSMYVEYKP